jgi:Homeodomain-like domain
VREGCLVSFDIVPPCLATSFRPQAEEVGDVAREVGGDGGQGRGTHDGAASRITGASPRWVYELCRRFDAEGEIGLEPLSRRPLASPRRTPEAVEEEIVALRKELADQGLDAGSPEWQEALDR